MLLLDDVREFLMLHRIRKCTVTAALSGGADSVSLLHALYKLRYAFSLKLHAIHIQHNLRGEESERDEWFCRELCRMYKIPLTVVSCDVIGYAKEHRLSVETAARECRYQAFEAHCEGYVATAHTASDNAETILQRLARGTGVKGLCGIPPVRGQFIRPLLHVTRDEVIRYVKENTLVYMTDSTNADVNYRRNFIRHRVIPPLKECNPSLERTCADMTEILSTEEDFLAEQAACAYGACLQPDGSLKGLEQLHPAMQRRCIAMFLEQRGFANRHHILQVQKLLSKGGTAELQRGGLQVHVSRGYLRYRMPGEEIPRKPLHIGENCIYTGLCAETEVIPRTDAEKFARIHTLFANSVLDYDIINKNAEFHGRIPGLRMRTPGSIGTVAIKKWLNAKVLPSERETVHYLSDEEGLLWVQGLGAAERAAVTERTQNMLYIRIITK